MKLSDTLVSGHCDLAGVVIYDWIRCLNIKVVKSCYELPLYLLLAFITLNAVERQAHSA